MMTINHSTRQLPDGVRCFKRKNEMMAALEEQGFGVPVVFDLPNGQAKTFVLYRSLEQFKSDIRSLPQEHWNAYEIIRHGMPCLAHADIDFKTTSRDPDHTRIKRVLQEIAQTIRNTYGIEPDFQLLCSTRVKGRFIKHSYHITVLNLAFSSNKDPRLKEIFRGSGCHWSYDTDKGRQSIVDEGIYSADRYMRFAFCSKAGDFGPLLPLSFDLKENTIEQLELDDPLSHLDEYLISNPVLDEKILFIQPDPERPFTAGPIHTETREKRVRDASVPREPRAKRVRREQIDTPFDIDDVSDVLRSCGEMVTKLSTATKLNEDKWSIQGNKGSAVRPCLYGNNKWHESNNCCIPVKRIGNVFEVYYHCYASECKDLGDLLLGTIGGETVEPDQTADEPDQPAEEPEQPVETGEVDQPGETVVQRIFKRPPEEIYSALLVQDLPLDQRVIALRSPCGTGKTKAFIRWLELLSSNKDLRVIYVSHRKAVSRKAMATLPEIGNHKWHIYDEIEGEIDIREYPFVVVQYESLCRVTGYDSTTDAVVLVLDELNSIFHQMHGVCGDITGAQECFYDLCRSSDHVIAMDGYLDQERLEILEAYTGTPAHLIHNRVASRQDQTFETTWSQKDARQYVVDLVKRGDKVICPCMNKTLAEKLFVQVKSELGESKRVILYTSLNPCTEMDIDRVWSEADLVIHTSTIDCGLSFEVSNYFGYCVCFFDNSSGPSHEAAAQMLSRARDVKRFLLCITETGFSKQTATPHAVLKDYEANKKAFKIDMEFFGIQGVRRNRSRDWASANPYLKALVMTDVVRRRARNGFRTHLTQLLLQDGAQVLRQPWAYAAATEKPVIVAQPGPPLVVPGHEQEKLKSQIDALDHQYKRWSHPTFDGFNQEDPGVYDVYAKPAKLNSFKNLCMLAAHGPDIHSALQQKTRDIAKLAAGLELCSRSGRYNEAFLTKAGTISGVEGPACYDLVANQTAIAFCHAMTGVQDPFQIKQETNQEIAERLGCQLVKLVGKNGKSEREQLVLPPVKAKEVLDRFRDWVQVRPELHTPYRTPKVDELTLVKALHLLDHVLRIMFDMEYGRVGESMKRCNGKRVNVYTHALQDSPDFQRFKPDQPMDKHKPVVPAWVSVCPADLPESQLLAVKGDMVQPAAAFTRRQTNDFRLKCLPGIEKHHVEGSSKRFLN